jgi:hypothetical protein
MNIVVCVKVVLDPEARASRIRPQVETPFPACQNNAGSGYLAVFLGGGKGEHMRKVLQQIVATCEGWEGVFFSYDDGELFP